MRLQKLAGFGPLAAIVSGLSLVLCLAIMVVGPRIDPGFGPVSVVLLAIAALAAALWPAALVVVGADLQWLEHPATNTRRMKESLWAVAVAALMFPTFGILVAVASNTSVPAFPLGLLGLLMAYYLIVQNWEARRAGLLPGALPWIGLIAGLCFEVMGLGFLAGLANATFFALGFFGFLAATVAFVIWSLWLGVRLRTTTRLPGSPAGAPA